MSSRLVEQLGARSAAGASSSSLSAQIRALVLDGRLTVGERLPSERALATELRRSRSTVTRAYDLLEQDGFAVRVHGGGTRVALPHHAAPPAEPAPDDAAIDLSIAAMGSTPGLYDATVRSLPRLAALRGMSGYSLQGLPELRDAVAQRFTARGATTSADEILITSGALSGMNLVLATLGRRGERALVEQPTFPHALEALRRSGYRLLPTPVDVDGWDEHHLVDLLLRSRPLVGYLIPDFHNPTGATLPAEARGRIVTTARSVGTHLIVDETTAELDIDRGWSAPPMAAFGPNVVTIGSMSKIAWGGMRLGWIRAERTMIQQLLAVRPSFELGTALLEQCIAVELLDDMTALTSHVTERLRAGRDAVRDGLSRIDGLTMPPTPGGLAAWLDLGTPVSTRLSLAAREHGLVMPPGPRFSTGGVLESRLRIPISLSPDRTRAALQKLALAWDDVQTGAAASRHPLARPTVI